MPENRIHFLAREPHFFDHLLPTYLALPRSLQGFFYVDRRMSGPCRERLQIKNAVREVRTAEFEKAMDGTLFVVSSYRDLKLARRYGHPVVLSEHGAGQSYVGSNSGSYIGSDDRYGVEAVLVPGQNQAARHHAVHPTIPAYTIGCPKLDPHHANPRPYQPKEDPVIAVSFHWDCLVVPETRTAYQQYYATVKQLSRRYNILAHAHPRLWPQAFPAYRSARLKTAKHFEQVIEEADIYVCDNSSTMFEWLTLDRPVVVLNAPRYRRDVEHGMRFWEYADMGPNVWRPDELEPAIKEIIAESPENAARRRQIAKEVYAVTDGNAAKTAADALKEINKQKPNPAYSQVRYLLK